MGPVAYLGNVRAPARLLVPFADIIAVSVGYIFFCSLAKAIDKDTERFLLKYIKISRNLDVCDTLYFVQGSELKTDSIPFQAFTRRVGRA